MVMSCIARNERNEMENPPDSPQLVYLSGIMPSDIISEVTLLVAPLLLLRETAIAGPKEYGALDPTSRRRQ